MEPIIKRLIYTLGTLQVAGRENLELLLAAMRALQSGPEPDYAAVRGALCMLTVRGERDVSSLLGCIQQLDKLIGEEPDRPEEPERALPA